MVGLWMRRGTKNRREEFGLFSAEEGLGLELLRRLQQASAADAPGATACGLTAQQYAAALKKALVRIWLSHLGLSPAPLGAALPR